MIILEPSFGSFAQCGTKPQRSAPSVRYLVSGLKRTVSTGGGRRDVEAREIVWERVLRAESRDTSPSRTKTDRPALREKQFLTHDIISCMP